MRIGLDTIYIFYCFGYLTCFTTVLLCKIIQVGYPISCGIVLFILFTIQYKILTIYYHSPQEPNKFCSNKPKPTALIWDEVEFIFDDKGPYCNDLTIPKAILTSCATLVVPHGTVFEIRNKDNKKSFDIIIFSDYIKDTGFVACDYYKKSTNTEPRMMECERMISLFTKNKDIFVRLNSGTRYQKVINNSGCECNGFPIIDTIPPDEFIDAYISNIPNNVVEDIENINV